MTSFNRVILLALLYIAVLTAAVPVLDETEVFDSNALEARTGSKGRPARPKPRPRPVPKPLPKQPLPKRPTPVHVPPKKATPVHVPPKKATPVHVPPKKATPVHVPPKKTTPVHVPPKQTTSVHVPPKNSTTGHQTTVPHGGNTTAAACPLPAKKPAKTTKPRALLEYVTSFFTKRANPEFIGWHGTNSNTAEVWHNAGYLKKPWSWMDIIAQERTGGSGANQELGSGVYVTDEYGTAQGFANINAGQAHNSGSTAVICAIFAKDGAKWRSNIPKAWLPTNIIGDSEEELIKKQLEEYRLQWLERVYPTSNPGDVIRIGPLDKSRGHPPGQLLIPSSLTRNFYAVCVSSTGGRLPAGSSLDIDYDEMRGPWHVLDRTCV